MVFGVVHGDGGEPGVEGEPVSGSPAQLRCGLWVGAGVCQGEPVPEFPEPGFLGLGDDAVGHGVADAPLPALLESLVDGGVGFAE